MTLCVCDSGKPDHDCCAPHISGQKPAPNPESLMRSRYTAYTQANIDYIVATMRGAALDGFNPEEAAQWARAVKWLRLQVLAAPPVAPGEDKGTVEFKAHYLLHGAKQILHENSQFERHQGRWYYVGSIPNVQQGANSKI